MTGDLARVLADIDTLLPPGAPSNPYLDFEGDGESWEYGAMRWSPVDHDDHPDRPAPPEPGDDDYEAPCTTVTVAATLSWAEDRGSADVPFARGQRVPTTTTWVNDWMHSPLPPADEPDRPDRAGVLIERSGWHLLTWPGLESAARAAAENESAAYRASLEQLGLTAQHTTTNLQHLRDRIDQAQQVIDARRHRNTGPANPRGIDGRARRHQHPNRAAADNAQPATQGAATPFVRAWLDAIGDPEPWPTVVLARRGDGTLVVGFDGAGPAPDAVWVDEPWDVGLR